MIQSLHLLCHLSKNVYYSLSCPFDTNVVTFCIFLFELYAALYVFLCFISVLFFFLFCTLSYSVYLCISCVLSTV